MTSKPFQIINIIMRGGDNMRIPEKYRNDIQQEINKLENHEGKQKIRPQDLAVIRILQNMLTDDQLPWEKSFIAPSMNVVSKKQYTGINRWILPGGEYITLKQLIDFNNKHKTNYRLPQIEDGDDFRTKIMKSPHIVMHYNTKPARKATKAEVARLEQGEKIRGSHKDEDTGVWMIQPPASSSYFRVYNTVHIKDPDTGKSFPRLNIEEHITLFSGEKILSEYQKLSGVKIVCDTPGRCFYTRGADTIHMSPLNTFQSTSKNLDPVVEYYSTAFHEMGHSTGTEARCNRECFKDWDGFGGKSYSVEECVAEFCAAMMLSELQVDHSRIDKTLDNSSSYITGWIDWILGDKDSKYGKGVEKLVYAIRRAEKARNYIMSWFDEVASSN